ncbi:helix-turn-helix domain-containing protein [Microbacterium sp. MYb66]|uniref:helix-turn-helix domain-containing protein n=1 Tax=Microbacterium sp. MYb66 TaxID=1848692 RepID=UPI0015E373C7|nr:helix-turn-helix domain-containing protein [Microbacterium sp. MYb66]
MGTLHPTEETEFTLWDVNETAAATGLAPRYVRKIIDERRLPVVKIGRYVRLRPADVREYIAASTLAPTTGGAR